MQIAIIGSGYVGLVTGSCLAELGNKVICVDSDKKKVAALKKGKVPIYEPGLEELVRNNLKRKRLYFGSGIGEAVKSAQVIFIAVGTPSLADGEADLTGIENVARHIALHMDGYRLIVEKSTVPVETGEWVRHTLATYVRKKIKFDVASNPEFLREGSAISDFMHPDRIVIGVESARAKELLLRLYQPLKAPIVVTNIKSAELIKHASNAFLATKISFINAIAQICDKVGADVAEVARGMGLDKRIGQSFLNAGAGYGGSCFPKDLDAFITISRKLGYDFRLLESVREINVAQAAYLLKKIKDAIWILKDKTIGVLGLAFKPDTDDIRNAPALAVISALQAEGAKVKAYDPQAMPRARLSLKGVVFCPDAYAAAKGADCLLVMTEWNEFKELDFQKVKKLLRRPLLVDGRNIYDRAQLRKKGFTYICLGRVSCG
jgi:UDPglucose 6-dehydrogenase